MKSSVDAVPKMSAQVKLTGLLLALGSLGLPGVSDRCFLAAAINEALRLAGRIAGLRIAGGLVLLSGYALVRTQGGSIDSGTAWALAVMAVPAFAAAYTLAREGAAHARFAALSLVAGATAHALLNAVAIFREHGFAPSTRLFDDVWTGEVWNATGQASVFVPLIGALPFLLFGREKKGQTAIGWALLVLALWAAAALASRTMISLLVVSFGLGLAILLRRRDAGMRVVGVVAMALIGAAILVLVVPSSALSGLPLVSRLGAGDAQLGEDPRLERWRVYLTTMWDVPSGEGILQRTIGYAHNIWLDAYDSEGVLPFTFLVLFGMAFVSGVVRVMRRSQPDTSAALLMAGMGVAWFLQASTEPLIYLSPYVFVAGCGVAGATSGLLAHGEQNQATPGPDKGLRQDSVRARW